MRRRPLLSIAFGAALVTSSAPLLSGESSDPGAAIYNVGIGESGEPIVANAGALELTGAAARCVNCHRHPRDGGNEGGVSAPPLLWSAFVTTRTGNAGYDEAAFMAAVRKGVGPDGRELHRLMPRYRLSDGELRSLIGFLKRPHAMPGVMDDTLTIATIVPAQAGLRAMGERSARAVSRLITRDDDRYFGRRIRHVIVDAAQPLGEIATQLAKSPPMLVLGSVGLADEGPVAALLAEQGIANVAPVAALIGDEPAEQILPLRAGMREQAAALARRAQETQGCVSILAADDPISARAGEALRLLFESTPDCPALLLLSAPSLVRQTLNGAGPQAHSRLYVIGAQMGPQLATLARDCPVTAAMTQPPGLAAQVDLNAQLAVKALQTALARMGRDISPARLRATIRQAMPQAEPDLVNLGKAGACQLTASK